MQINFLKKVVENIAGEQAVQIVDLLYGKKDINEFLIAKKLNLTINQTRNLLYRLSHLGIINSIRKKDKRKGWYIYFWTFNVMKSLEVLASTIDNELAALNQDMSNKKLMRYYKCKICGREADEEAALLTNFICSECGEVYSLADNTPFILEIAKKIEKLQKERNSIQAEIDVEEGKKGKKLNRFLKKEEKKKKDLRQKNAKLKASLIKKYNKKNPSSGKKVKTQKKISKKIKKRL